MIRLELLGFFLFLFLVQLVHSWSPEERGDPFKDGRFRNLTTPCRFGHDHYDCPRTTAECKGAPSGYCFCLPGYVNPDKPGSENITPRCVTKDEAEIADDDPRWQSLLNKPCAANCAKTIENSECDTATNSCVCVDGYIGDPTTMYKTCKKNVDSSGMQACSSIGMIILALGIAKIFSH